MPRPKTSRLILIFSASLWLTSACSSDTLPPVSDTRPSQDDAILNAEPIRSDGQPLLAHVTTTVVTSTPILSTGVIGGVAVDQAGNVYNADFDTTVWRTAPDGTTVVLNSEFRAASGNMVLANGDLLQGEYRDNKIYRIKPDGTRSVFSEAGLEGPVGMVQRPNGDIIVACYRGGYLARVPENGGPAVEVLRDERMTNPNGVTIDDAGNIYVADLESSSVFRWSPDGNLDILAELPGAGNAHNVIANGALYVNKIWDHVIYRVELDTGAYAIVSGNGRAGYDDGLTGVATIEEPNGIATNAAKDTVYFNTHRGEMGGEFGYIVLRKLEVAEGSPG